MQLSIICCYSILLQEIQASSSNIQLVFFLSLELGSSDKQPTTNLANYCCSVALTTGQEKRTAKEVKVRVRVQGLVWLGLSLWQGRIRVKVGQHSFRIRVRVDNLLLGQGSMGYLRVCVFERSFFSFTFLIGKPCDPLQLAYPTVM